MEPDDEKEDTRPKIIRTTDLQKTQGQVYSLLSIIDKSTDLLACVKEPGYEWDVDENAKGEAQKTHWAAHRRLRLILDDSSRWEPQDKGAEKLAQQALRESVKQSKAEQARIAEDNRPSSRLKPNLALLDPGWVAWYGTPEPSTISLHGIGQSPEAALEAFDKAYHARVKIDKKRAHDTAQKALQAAEEMARQAKAKKKK